MKKLTLSSCVSVSFLAFMMAVLAGCATTVNFNVQRPPVWNTLGIQRLAIMPFTTSGHSDLQRAAANYLTSAAREGIAATNHFTIVDHSAIERDRRNAENLADAIFSGQVTSATVSDSSKQGSYKDKNGNTINYIDYSREVQLVFSYNLTLTRNSEIVGTSNRTLSTSSTARDDRSRLTSADALIHSLVRREMSGVGRMVAPYYVTERRRFEKETSDDNEIRQRAKNAETMVKEGSYKGAQAAFLGIYQDSGSFAAAFNTGLLIEIMGDREGAVEFYQRAYNETGNPKFSSEIARLQGEISNAGLLEAYKENQNARDKLIARMIEELTNRMPSDPKIALINNSQVHTELADTVTNGILEGFLAKNITVIDRNNRALMDMERNYQRSGNVSNEQMVSIGHVAGVNTFIFVSVTGSGAARRLSVRMTDVERSTIIYQSPQSDEMNL